MEANNKLVTELSLDSSKFKSELNAAKASVSSFSDHAKSLGIGLTAAFAVGTAAATAFGVALLNNAEKMEAVAKNAERLSISYQSFQSLAYAANQSDVSIDSVSAAMARLQKNVYAAQTGNKEAAQTFAELGLRVSDFKGMQPDDIFKKVGSAINGIQDPTKQTALLLASMGKGGMGVMNLLKADIKGLEAEFASLGIALSDAQKDAVGSANDSKKRLNAVWEGFANQLTADLAPAFDLVVKSIIDVIKETGGLKQAAAGMASSLISGVAMLIEVYDRFLDILTEVHDKIIDIANAGQVVDRTTVAYNTAVQLASGNVDAAFDPRVVGFVGQSGDLAHKERKNGSSALLEHSGLLMSLRTQAASLQDTANGVGGPKTALDAMVAALGKAKEAVDKNTVALSNTGLKELFGIDGKEGANYIKTRLGASDTKQASSSDFDQVLQEIKESLSKGGGPSLNEQLQKLIQERENARTDASFESLNQQIAGKTPGEISFTGMDAAIKNIENEINKLQGKGAPEVIVTLKVDEQGLIKAFVDGAPGSNAVKESARTLMREEASGVTS